MLGHDQGNMAPLCELKGTFLSWCSTTHPQHRQQPQVFLSLYPHCLCVKTPKESRLAHENKTAFPDSHYKYAICANLTSRWKIKLRKLNLLPWSHNPGFICPPLGLLFISQGNRRAGWGWSRVLLQCMELQRMRLSHQRKSLILLQIL